MSTSIKSSSQKVLWALSIAFAFSVMSMSFAPVVDAAAYTKGVYPPNRIGATTIEGWADLSLDCTETFGCWNYIKIERRLSPYDPAFLVHPVDPPVEYVAGGWATQAGWAAISAELSLGCWEYRTHVDSYNRYPASYGFGVDARGIGVSYNDTNGNIDHMPWSSDWTTHCLYV
ncbi:MAG: hypothetical protein M3P51_15150 [Chloroflexota bacterium]|nr:hypothetical protein [Chloroflexota bacterium]